MVIYTGSVLHGPCMSSLMQKLVLLVRLDRIVTAATIHRPTFTGFERHLGLLSTLSTNRGEHLALSASAEATAFITLYFFRLAAVRAAFGFVGKTLGSIEFLLTCGEGESFAAICTRDRFVCETHGMASLFFNYYWVRVRAIQDLNKLEADYQTNSIKYAMT